MIYYDHLQEKRRWFGFHFKYLVVLVDKYCSSSSSTLLIPFTSPSPAVGGGGGGIDVDGTIVTEITVVEHQRQVVGIFTVVFFGSDADARAAIQGGKESHCDAVNEPHGHPIKLSATTTCRRSTDPVAGFNGRIWWWSETEEAAAAAWRRGCGSHRNGIN